MKQRRSYTQDYRQEGMPHYSGRRRSGDNGNGHWREPDYRINADVRPLLLDSWALTETVLRRWYYLVLGGVIMALLFGLYGWTQWKPYHSAGAQLMRFEQKNSTEFFQGEQMTTPTFIGILESPDLLQRVARTAVPPLSPHDLRSRLLVSPGRESDLIYIDVTAETPHKAVELANLYATHAVRFFQEMQIRHAGQALESVTNQIRKTDEDIEVIRKALLTARPSAAMQGAGSMSLSQRLQAAREELQQLLTEYTTIHPKVGALQSKIKALEEQVEKAKQAQGGSNDKNVAPDDPEILRATMQLELTQRLTLSARQRELEMIVKNPPGYCQVFAMAELKNAMYFNPARKILFFSIVGGLGGVGFVIFMIVLLELLDNRLKTVADLKRVARLPVLATLGDIEKMHPSAQSNWAFRTWTAMQSRLSPSPNHGLVCGFTSSSAGQGRSTWIRLLAKAASQCGFRVLTIATLPSPPFMEECNETQANGKPHDHGPNGSPFGDEPSMAVANNVLSTPAAVTEKLTGDNPQPLVHIPLPGWVWNLERRKQWQAALEQWRSIENVVILVELPPAADPEAVLLAENIPNVIWLSDGSKADATDSREQLQTLRDARCNLVGAVMNRTSSPKMRKRFSRWVGVWPLLAGICLGPDVFGAQDNAPATPAPPATRLSITNEPVFSASSSRYRAEWQQRFTLGPGDVLNISLYGKPEMTRLEVMIGPDGNLSYLEATALPAAGLTVDELRQRLNEALGQFYRSPHTIITPVTYRSKKYYVLGKVSTTGVFTLDRPTTVLEAVARARGLQTGLLENQSTFELADLQRSFLVRRNQRVPVNFEKLFFEGDLTQNIPLEPDDYLFFAAGNIKEVYVLGEVRLPGPVTYTDDLSVVKAIAGRNGYTDKAFKSRVVVVRGSLHRPETFIVDTWAALDARGLDFQLQPKDIIYVHNRPFIRVEELLDLAATAFIQAATAAWAGEITTVITSPFIPAP